VKFITSSVDEILKEISLVAEAEIERGLTEIVAAAIEKNKDQLLKKVMKQYSYSCHATLIRAMDSQGMKLEFSFKPKNEDIK